MTLASTDIDYGQVSPTAVQSVIREALGSVHTVVQSEQFQSMLREFWRLAPSDRADFVDQVLLNPTELRLRFDLVLPDDVLLQRSSFADGRPTLFCLCKHLEQPAGGWQKVTITFDNVSQPAGL